MSVRTYNPSVRVGNWNEDIQLEEDTLKDFLEKREKGELSFQKRSKLQQTLFKPIQLSISRDGCVHYGDIINLRCLGAQDRTKYTHAGPRETCSLSVVPDCTNLLELQKLEGTCTAGGSTDLEPRLRNSFVITSINDDMPKGSKLCYGQDFYLRTLGDEGGNLYMGSDRTTLDNTKSKSRHQEIKFVSAPSALTKWYMQYYDPQLRMEYEGIPVPSNAITIISHRTTNRNLSVEEDFSIRPFGKKEYEISAHVYQDSHRAEKDVNRWLIVMGEPGDEVLPTVHSDLGQKAS